MKILVLSDIHGNRTALREVITYTQNNMAVDSCIILGDIIDYGMHSNDVIKIISNLDIPIVCNIRGNHEQSIIKNDYCNYSSVRGRECAKYTRSTLSNESWDYILNSMDNSGKKEFSIDGKKCLAVHGDIEDIYWGQINREQVLDNYASFDFVFSGHSHVPHFIEEFFYTNNPLRRNMKKTIFINPGSVGQPRNLNPTAQFAVFDTITETVLMEKIQYNIKEEQASYVGQVDDFYKERLEWGI